MELSYVEEVIKLKSISEHCYLLSVQSVKNNFSDVNVVLLHLQVFVVR